MGTRSLNQIIEDTQRDRIYRVLDQALIHQVVYGVAFLKFNPFFAKDTGQLAELIRKATSEPITVTPEPEPEHRFAVSALTTINGSPHIVLRDLETKGMKVTVPTSFAKWAQLAAFGIKVEQ